ncbi:FHA domain-containing protein [Nocardioides sp.]|uniref:FHA domain-containing protein n=1 Tax=Nocardioides sp. TaxID=35761 RepID=UPI0026271A66|nr:FHA domain-containing protein [Nocardioides sp.]
MTDRTLTYRPGSWLGIVGENATVLLPGTEKARAGALWALIDDGAGFDTVLDALVAGGLSALPGFVLLAGAAGSVRVLVRGEAAATFETDQGQLRVAADPGAMWAERTVEARDFAISLPGEEADGPQLAVTDGLVRLGSLETPATAAPLAPVVQLAPVAPIAPVAPVVSAPPVPPAPLAPPVPAAPIPVPVPPVVAVPPVAPAVPDFLDGPLHGHDDVADAADATDTADPADEDAVGPEEPEAPFGTAVPEEVAEPVAPVQEPSYAAAPTEPPAVDLDQDDLPTDIFAAYDPAAEAPAVTEAPAAGAGLDQVDDAFGADAPDDDDAVTDEQAAIDAPLAGPTSPPPSWTPERPERPEAAAPAAPPAPPKAQPAHLTFSHGAEIDVAGLIVIGRNPDAGRFPADDQPFVVTVPSPHSEISSTHAEVRPGTGEDAGKAVVTDLGSTNGTLVVQPGQRPEELRAGVPVVLASGALIDLGDGLTIRVR